MPPASKNQKAPVEGIETKALVAETVNPSVRIKKPLLRGLKLEPHGIAVFTFKGGKNQKAPVEGIETLCPKAD